ncbi:hypothetical protein BKA64DRAFT_753153 [Cadophora sp. MPI-SDFR-AT-0126]|nr:hypothetical protein BKA64DRAFT_753153 [Leotiomycetes sp. MPI-SDFR-AT-0126]
MAGSLYLGNLRCDDGQIYKARAEWEKVGQNLRIRVMDQETGKLFPANVLGSRKPLDCVDFRTKLSIGWAEYLADDDTYGITWAPQKKQDGEKARVNYLKSQWLKTNEDPSKKGVVSTKTASGNAEDTKESAKTSSKSTTKIKNDSSFHATGEKEEVEYFKGTCIAMSSSHIKKGSFSSFDTHASRVIDQFLRGKLVPSFTYRRDGVSSMQAIESAFYKHGYRINVVHAVDASLDLADKKLTSITKSRYWKDTSVFEEREIDDRNTARRLLQGEKLTVIQDEKRKVKYEKRENDKKRKASEVEVTEDIRDTPVTDLPSNPSTGPVLRHLPEPLQKMATLGSQWTYEFHRKEMIRLGRWEKSDGEDDIHEEPKRYISFTAEKRRKLADALRKKE